MKMIDFFNLGFIVIYLTFVAKSSEIASAITGIKFQFFVVIHIIFGILIRLFVLPNIKRKK